MNVERRFRVLRDFVYLRPVHHCTEERVRGHIALCVVALIEAVMGNDLARVPATDPELSEQTMTPRRAITELNRIRLSRIEATVREIELVTGRNALQTKVLKAVSVDTSSWERATIV
jgi:hypothetical protein